MNRLKGLSVYLCGPIDEAEDLGQGWRDEVKEAFRREKFGVGILSPLEKPLPSQKEDEHDLRKIWRKNKEFDKLRNKMDGIRRVDLRLVDKSDFLIVRLNNVRASGTLEELFHGNRIKRPVLIWSDYENISDWMFAAIPYQYMFPKLDDLMDYLRRVDQGLENDNKRWIFFDWNLVEYI